MREFSMDGKAHVPDALFGGSVVSSSLEL